MLGRALSVNENAAAIAIVIGVATALLTRELLDDYYEDHKEQFIRT